MAAEADEPLSMNYVRKHALQQAEEMGINSGKRRLVLSMPLVPTPNIILAVKQHLGKRIRVTGDVPPANPCFHLG